MHAHMNTRTDRDTHKDPAMYLPRSDCLTHEDLVVGSKLWRVVVDVLYPDVHTNFGVLVVTAYTHTHCRRGNDQHSAAVSE